MTRTKAQAVVRHLVSGAVRADETGGVLDCVLLAPPPDWVAIDLASGALVRSSLSGEPVELAGAATPLAPVRLRLAAATEPWDPSRPEGIEVSEAAEGLAPSRRSVHRLLDEVSTSDGAASLLGTVASSLSFVDLEGNRPSVTVLAPSRGQVRLTTDEPLMAYFALGEREHSLPVAPAAHDWVRSGEIPSETSRSGHHSRSRRRSPSRSRLRGSDLEPSVPVLLVVGLARPAGGQVRKVVLGLVPAR
ncbi:MAG: hypothetical protein ACYDGN_14785 [Acidimicrobiales bacterium]